MDAESTWLDVRTCAEKRCHGISPPPHGSGWGGAGRIRSRSDGGNCSRSARPSSPPLRGWRRRALVRGTWALGRRDFLAVALRIWQTSFARRITELPLPHCQTGHRRRAHRAPQGAVGACGSAPTQVRWHPIHQTSPGIGVMVTYRRRFASAAPGAYQRARRWWSSTNSGGDARAWETPARKLSVAPRRRLTEFYQRRQSVRQLPARRGWRAPAFSDLTTYGYAKPSLTVSSRPVVFSLFRRRAGGTAPARIFERDWAAAVCCRAGRAGVAHSTRPGSGCRR